jgi:long-chain acyl-CoA synthetase
MSIDFLLDTFHQNSEKESIVWNDQFFSYQWLIEKLNYWYDKLIELEIKSGTLVSIEADFSPNAIALLLALIKHECLIMPIHYSTTNKERIKKIAQAEYLFRVDEEDQVTSTSLAQTATHEYYKKLRKRNHPGLVLFSSGTSGEPKGAVHDFVNLLEKFKKKRTSLKIVNFLLFDHWGGLNTMFHTLSNGGTVLVLSKRAPDAVCEFIEKYGIEVLPTSPTFLNLLLISEAYKRYNLGSLTIISYGTEPMSESTLQRLNNVFPDVNLLQTYGLIEVGVLRSKSKAPNSLWVKVGGEGYQTRIVDGLLEIKAKSTMLGYLNAPNPFTDDGWYQTGDSVEVNGEYIKILGRKSEMINVGGEKVYPAEIESIIQECDNISDVTAYGEKNPITGQIVCVKIQLIHEENHKDFKRRLKKYCGEKMPSFQVPVKIEILTEKLHNERHKKLRSWKSNCIGSA